LIRERSDDPISKNQVTVLVSDTLAEQATDAVLAAAGVEEETAVVEGRIFLNDLLDSQLG